MSLLEIPWSPWGPFGVSWDPLGYAWGSLGGHVDVIFEYFFNNSDVISKPFWVPKVVDFGGQF